MPSCALVGTAYKNIIKETINSSLLEIKPAVDSSVSAGAIIQDILKIIEFSLHCGALVVDEQSIQYLVDIYDYQCPGHDNQGKAYQSVFLIGYIQCEENNYPKIDECCGDGQRQREICR